MVKIKEHDGGKQQGDDTNSKPIDDALSAELLKIIVSLFVKLVEIGGLTHNLFAFHL